MATDPGETLKSAKRISLSSKSQTFSDTLSSSDRADVYRFRVGRQRSSLHLSLSGLESNVGVTLIDDKNRTLRRKTTQGDRLPSLTHNLKHGIYYVQLTSTTGETPYRLKLSTIPDLAGDRRDNANQLGRLRQATLKDAIGNQDARDLYGFTVEGRRQFALTLNTGATTTVEARLLRRDGSLLKKASANESGQVFLSTPLNAGTYYVQLSPKDKAIDSRYELKLTTNPLTLPPLPQITLKPVAQGFQDTTYVTTANDGSNRLFVTEKGGRIRIVQNGNVRSTPFLDISKRVSTTGEDGLLSVAFPANYAQKRYFYVYYTNIAGNNVVARYRLTADGNVANANSEKVILTIPHPDNSNHNGGQLAFGPDGYLYIATGDGGGGGDPRRNAQNPQSLLGKILRIDVESSGSAPYRIPTTNPFTKANDPNNRYRDEIWALGLRNPWRFSFDRQTGNLYIADVGQGAYEEVDFQPANSKGGQNYGWNLFEGTHPYNGSTANPRQFTSPVTEYDHSQGESVTGGYVYRGAAEPALRGTYLYGDFISGNIWGLRRSSTGWETQLLLDSPYQISTFGQDEQGNLYAADYGGGTLYRIATTSS